MNWPRTNLGLGLMVEGPNPADAVVVVGPNPADAAVVVGPNPADAVVVGLVPTLETPMDLIQTMVDD